MFALEGSVDALCDEPDEDYRKFLRMTLIDEITHLAAWLRQNSNYDFEEDLKRLESKLFPAD